MDERHKQSVRSMSFAQVCVDAVSDLLDVPLFIVQKSTIPKLYESLERFLPNEMQTIENFSSWIAEDKDSPKIPTFDRGDLQKWRPFFKRLSRELYVVYPNTSEPLITKLRNHWVWRWCELHGLAQVAAGRPPTFSFDGVGDTQFFKREFRPLANIPGYLCIGPTKAQKASSDARQVQFSDYLDKIESSLKKSELNFLHDRMELVSHFSDRLGLQNSDRASRGHIAVNVIDRLVALNEKCRFNADRKTLRVLVTLLACDELDKLAGSRSIGIASTSCLTSNKIELTLVGADQSRKDRKSFSQSYGNKEISIFYPASQSVNEHKIKSFLERFDDLRERLNTKETLRNAEAVSLVHSMLDRDFKFSYDTIALLDDSINVGSDSRISILSRRLARIIARTTSADACRVYYFSRQKAELVALGGHSDLAQIDAKFDDVYMNRSELTELQDSISYAAVRDGRVKLYSEGSSEDLELEQASSLFDIHPSIVQPPDGASFPIGRSVVAVPILIHSRSWGVIEIASSSLCSFGIKEIGSLIKFAEAIGNDLHSLNVTRLFRNLSNEILENNQSGSIGRQRNLDNLVARVCNLYLGDMASIWMRDVFDTQEFRLLGSTETPSSNNFDLEKISFRLDDDLSNTGSLFTSEKKCLIGVIGEGSFGPDWVASSNRRKGLAERYKGIAIVALYDRKGGPIGSLSIYSEAPFEGDKWQHLGSFISEYASALVEYLLGLKVEAAARLSLDQHEIDNNILFTKARITKLDQQVFQIFSPGMQVGVSPLSAARSEFRSFHSDMNEYLGQIKSIASYSRDRRRDVTASPVYSEYSRKDEVPPWTSLREIVNVCFQAVRERYDESGVSLRPDYSQLMYAIKAYPADLRTIFTNLSSNAVKHSRYSSTLLISAIANDYTFTVHVKNIAPPMKEEDRVRIFEAEFRGDRAIREETDGHGLGLFIARAICEEYQFDINHNQDKLAGNGLVWHNFSVEIPSVDVKRDF